MGCVYVEVWGERRALGAERVSGPCCISTGQKVCPGGRGDGEGGSGDLPTHRYAEKVVGRRDAKTILRSGQRLKQKEMVCKVSCDFDYVCLSTYLAFIYIYSKFLIWILLGNGADRGIIEPLVF